MYIQDLRTINAFIGKFICWGVSFLVYVVESNPFNFWNKVKDKVKKATQHPIKGSFIMQGIDNYRGVSFDGNIFEIGLGTEL